MQHLWRLKVEWDEVVPALALAKWRSIYTQLSPLNQLNIPRWTGLGADSVQIELHGFGDASNAAYAAAVYLCVVDASGRITSTLLAGKSKVAPLKTLSVPHLELCAAVLHSRLVEFVSAFFGLRSVRCVCWADSTIVLAWIRSHPSRWKIFVANRVTEIQSRLPHAKWHHVATSDNPADCASRGLFGDEIEEHTLWWHGPPWLRLLKYDCDQEDGTTPADALREEKVITLQCSNVPISAQWDLETRYSSWPRLIRVTAYIIRFLNACRRRAHRFASLALDSTAPSPSECTDARIFWIKQQQSRYFSSEIASLANSRVIASKSSIIALNPFLDRDGVLRVGGQLKNSPFAYNARHPIILAPSPLIALIVHQAHLRTLHGGPRLTLNILQQEFWILRARNLVKKVIHKCVACAREWAAVPSQLMGDLSEPRVTPSVRSFLHCGLDYAGPIRIRASAGRGITARKAYIALFVCLAIKAVHLELVGDYSSPAFINSYIRFCARRGLPQSIYCDNGTTFVGAEKELTSFRAAIRDPNFLNKAAIIKSAGDNVSWHFIPPSAPHFGGLWEAGVRSVKHHLRRIIGDHTLTFEEFTTLLCGIEACLNSRLIASLSDTLDDFESLTPSHFLTGSVITVPPEPSLLEINENRLSRWQLVRLLTERFWKLWQTDYVNTLQQRNKWRKITPKIKISQLVLLRNSLLPPCKWELGRVTKLHEGKDQLPRVVTVKTTTAEYTRPIVKLCLLPVDSDLSNC